MSPPKHGLRRAAVTAAGLGLAAALGACGTPSLPDSTAVPVAGPALIAPAPYRDLCRREPDLCRPAPGAPTDSSLIVDAAMQALLTSVNQRINHTNRYERDADIYHEWDVWAVARGHGDCEDYALAKLALLLDKGVPRAALRLAVATRVSDGVRHAVLLVATDRGAYALDSSYDRLKPWSALPYTDWRVEDLPGGHWRRVPGSAPGADAQF